MKKVITGVIAIVLFGGSLLANADIVELPLAAEGEYTSGSSWITDFNLGVTFTEISNIYIYWSGTIMPEKVRPCVDSNITWPVDGKFLAILRDSNSGSDIANIYVYAGATTYPNSEPFDLKSELSEMNYIPGQLLVHFKDGSLTNAERNAILASYGGGTVTYSSKFVPGLSLVELPQNVTVQEALVVLNNAPEILHAQPNYIYHTLEYTYPAWEAFLGGKGTIEISFGKIYRSLELCTVEYPSGQLHSATLVFEGTVVPKPVVDAGVDIEPNTLNLASKGNWLTCHIRLPEDYNVTDIDPNSIYIEDIIAAERFEINNNAAIVKFSRSAVQGILTIGENEITVTGELMDGTVFEGIDTIRVINKGNKK